jgi:multisubunit Na+/H+ antiporter MnhF subunit
MIFFFFASIILVILLTLATLIVKRKNIINKIITINQIISNSICLMVFLALIEKEETYIDIVFFYTILGPISGLCLMIYYKQKYENTSNKQKSIF